MKQIVCKCLMFMVPVVLNAGVIATNQYVPLVMDSYSGTSEDPAEYLFYDGFSTNYVGGMMIGRFNSNIQCVVADGADVVVTGGDYRLYLGRNDGSVNNKLTIKGEGSSLSFGPHSADGSYWFQVGFKPLSSNNVVEVLDGGACTNAGWLTLHYGVDPSIVVDNHSCFYNFYRVSVGNSSNNGATVSVRDGSYFYVGSRMFVGANNKSEISVNGFGSILKCNGRFEYDGTNSIVKVEDQGLFQINSSTCLPTDASSFYGLAKGFIALKNTSMDPTVHVKLWNGDNWVQPLSEAEAEELGWSAVTYSSDAEALEATGYDGLGGYTVYTGGKSKSPKGTCIIVE